MAVVKESMYQTGYSGITHSDISAFLKRTLTTAEQALVGNLVTRIEATLCRKCKRQFKTSQDYSTDYPTGVSIFETNSYPIDSLTAIEIDGVDKTADYSEGTDYWIIDGLSIRFKSPLQSINNIYTGVKLTYQIEKFWGEDLEHMLIKWISYEFLKSENAGVGETSYSLGESSQNFDLRGFKQDQKSLVDFYTTHNL